MFVVHVCMYVCVCVCNVLDVCFISSELTPEEQFAQAVDRVVSLNKRSEKKEKHKR